MNITLRQLGYFLALDDERHFGRAAARVHVTQPALSMQIRDLESVLGTALVERGTRDLRLTAFGRDVAVRARRILGEVADIEALGRLQGLDGRLNLGIIPTVAPYLLARVLPDLRAQGKAPGLRVREAMTDTLLSALDRGTLDAIVIADPGPDKGLATAPLFEDRFLLAGQPGRLRRLSNMIDDLRPMALDPDQLLLLDEGHCLADQALDVCGLTRRQTRLDLGASSLSTLCGLAGQGMGLTFLPEISLGKEIGASPSLDALRFSAPEPARRIVLARRNTTAAAAWFDDLAVTLGAAGNALITLARQAWPVPVPR